MQNIPASSSTTLFNDPLTDCLNTSDQSPIVENSAATEDQPCELLDILLKDSTATPEVITLPELSDLSRDSSIYNSQQSTNPGVTITSDRTSANASSLKDRQYISGSSHNRLSSVEQRTRQQNINDLARKVPVCRYSNQDELRLDTSAPIISHIGKVRSPYWSYFKMFDTKRIDPSKRSMYQYMAVCTMCLKAALETNDSSVKFHINLTPSMSTSKLADHLRVYHMPQYEEINSQERSDVSSACSDIRKHCNTEKARTMYEQDVFTMTLNGNLPLSFCSNDAFRTFVNKYVKHTFPVHRNQMSKLMIRNGVGMKKMLVERLKSTVHLSFTTDSWTSSVQAVSYLSVTAHLITKNFQVHKYALACRPHNGTATAQDLSSEIVQVLADYEVNPSSVLAFVSDTNSTMAALAVRLKQSFGISWCSCIDHRIQLLTKLAFDDKYIPMQNKCMQRTRDLVCFLRQSPQASQAFKNIQRNLGVSRPLMLIQDVPTRWWSTYSMLERLLKLKTYVNIALDQCIINPSYRLSESQWKVLEIVSTLLEPFQIFQRLLEGDTYVTLSLVPLFLHHVHVGLQAIIQRLASEMHENSDDDNALFSSHFLCVEMKKKYVEEFDNDGDGFKVYVPNDTNRVQPKTRLGRTRGLSLETFLAAALDPRTKHLFGVSSNLVSTNDTESKTHQDLVWEQLLKKAVSLAEGRAGSTDATIITESETFPSSLVSATRSKQMFDLMKLIQENVDNHRPDIQVPTMIDCCKQEIEAYKKEPAIPLTVCVPKSTKAEEETVDSDEEDTCTDMTVDLFNDPLKWWKAKAHLYPTLAELASWYLGIPATSATSERLFSQAGITIDNDRNRISQVVAENEILLKLNKDLKNLHL